MGGGTKMSDFDTLKITPPDRQICILEVGKPQNAYSKLSVHALTPTSDLSSSWAHSNSMRLCLPTSSLNSRPCCLGGAGTGGQFRLTVVL